MLVCGGLALFRRVLTVSWLVTGRLVRPLSNGFENQAEATTGGGGATPELVLTGDCHPRRCGGLLRDSSGIRVRSSLFERECRALVGGSPAGGCLRNLLGVFSPLLWWETSGDCVCPCGGALSVGEIRLPTLGGVQLGIWGEESWATRRGVKSDPSPKGEGSGFWRRARAPRREVPWAERRRGSGVITR